MKDYNHFWEVYADASGFWRWRIRSHNRRIVAVSGESFASKGNAMRSIHALRRAMYVLAVHASWRNR